LNARGYPFGGTRFDVVYCHLAKNKTRTYNILFDPYNNDRFILNQPYFSKRLANEFGEEEKGERVTRTENINPFKFIMV